MVSEHMVRLKAMRKYCFRWIKERSVRDDEAAEAVICGEDAHCHRREIEARSLEKRSKE
jgi:hypothetical protein